jgi:peptidoglycan/LPS O-acetylase OafA/YrhL
VHTWLTAYYNFEPNFITAVQEGTWGAFVTTANYNLVLWTMPIELVGSLLVYAFLALFGSLRNRWLLYTIACGYLWTSGQYYFMDFFLGMALADVWAHNRKTWGFSLSLWPALGIIALGLFIVPWKPLTALLVVGATAFAPNVQRLLTARWLNFLGQVSFGLYLVHMPVFCSLGCGVYLFLCRQLGWAHMSAALLAGAASLCGSLLSAWCFYHVVDRPTIALTRRLDVWLFRRQSERGFAEGRSVVRVEVPTADAA